MADMMADWRLFGEHEQLKGATLWWRAYAPRNEILAQDQCAFCWATFARGSEDAWHEGYSTQPPHGMGAQESAPREPLADEEYITQVIAAVKAAPRSEPPKSEPAPTEPTLDLGALEAIKLPSTSSEPPKAEQVYWVCPQCFEDFAGEFGWRIANEGNEG